MAEPLLSATLIVRDEERFLEGCLASLDGLVDETVVVDTGSTDRTVEVARECGARLGAFPWCGDFATARNHALDLARGRWILYIDADERVVGGREATRERLEEPDLLGLTVRFRPVTGFTCYRENRLFRRHPRLRFRGVIHESHVPALGELVREGLGRTGSSPLCIDHLGYDGDLSHKHARNLPLLRERLERDPDHVFSWAHLGTTLEALGRPDEALATWRQGVETVRRRGWSSAMDALPFLALLARLAPEGREFRQLLEEAERRFREVPEVRWARARQRMAEERFEEALPELRKIAGVDPNAYENPLLAHDQRLFRVAAPEALGLCLFRLGRYRESARWWAAAEAAEPSVERRTKRRLAEARATRESAYGPPG